MRFSWRAVVLTTICCLPAFPASTVEELFRRDTGQVKLPPGVTVLHRELSLPATAHDLSIDGSGVTLRIAPDFQGQAAIAIPGGSGIQIRGITIDGNGGKSPVGAIVADKVAGLVLRGIRVSGTAGGILLQNGVHNFTVEDSELEHIGSPGILIRAADGARNSDGHLLNNRFSVLARSAIQVGQSTRISVEKNSGTKIGYPVDAEIGRIVPAAIQTAGDVQASQYRENSFEEVNGKCIGLDGFQNGDVRGNSCTNHEQLAAYPKGDFGIVLSEQSRNILIWGNHVEGFPYGAVLVEGSGNTISHNHFVHLNAAHCNETPGCLSNPGEPDLLRSGVYLRGPETRGNTIEANEISGFGMDAHCVIAGPGIAAAQNRIGHNDCTDDAVLSASLMHR